MVSVEEKLSDIERQNYLIKLQKEFAFAGAVIPSEIVIEGRRLYLKKFVFEMSKKRGSLTSEEISKIDEAISIARKKRKEIVDRLTREDLTAGQAKELYENALGINRAIDTLYMATEPKTSVDEEIKKAKIEEGRRWLNMIRKIYSREEKRKRD
ncbi:hypothetical protein CUJ83_08140 [Methanocella sp. CWC-04]|uniref:Uncharacterized protein n=2 Tax=Methanooceanicella nereidis TaxID=2052831 RepID=A0AAP2RDT5_9EURY|nr:hypothetical protein [Methanocella sp. CWC-04]